MKQSEAVVRFYKRCYEQGNGHHEAVRHEKVQELRPLRRAEEVASGGLQGKTWMRPGDTRGNGES